LIVNVYGIEALRVLRGRPEITHAQVSRVHFSMGSLLCKRLSSAVAIPVVEGLGGGIKPTVDQKNLLNALVLGGQVAMGR
jgi:hypothetical protein